jgi:hypothetical protein
VVLWSRLNVQKARPFMSWKAMVTACCFSFLLGSSLPAQDGLPDGAMDCTTAAERLRSQCLARGGTEEECQAVVDEFLSRCENQPPPSPTCEERCERAAGEMQAACIAAGGTEEECAARAAEFLEACSARCERETPPPPVSCEERCGAIAVRIFTECVEQGGDEAECRARADRFTETCLERCDGPPPPPACAEACADARRMAFSDCLAAGGTEAECAVAAQRVGDECRRACERPFPPDCRSRCEEGLEGLRRACELQGLSDEECQARVDAFLAGCGGGCREPPPAPPSCEERCARAAAAVRDACLAAGGTPEDCDASAADFLASCNDHCERPTPPSCEDRCARATEEAFAACIAGGGTEEDCRAQADGLLEACLVRCSEETPLPCDERCAQSARNLLARCQEAGRPAEECEEASNRLLAACLNGCDRTPPLPPACGERCAAAAESIAAACAARGGSGEECAAAVAAFIERCNAHCDDGGDEGEGGGAGIAALTPSEELCSEVASDLHAACLGLGHGAAECDLFTLSFTEKCAVVLEGVDDWFELAQLAPPRPFIRGDSNRTGDINIADPINTLNGIFLSSGNAFDVNCLDRLDSNDDGDVDISDALHTLTWLFIGGAEPPAPGPRVAGQDPTADLFVCFE